MRRFLVIPFLLLVIVLSVMCIYTSLTHDNNPPPTIASPSKPAPTTTIDTSYAYMLKVGKVIVTVKSMASKTVLTIGNKMIVNPDEYKYYPTATSFTVQCQPEREMLFIGDSKQEVFVSVLPIDTPAPKQQTNASVGTKNVWKLPGNTDITYRFYYRTKSTDGKRLYEIVQEEVENKDISTLYKVPLLFRDVVLSFKEVK